MSDTILFCDMTVYCQDGVTCEHCSAVIRDSRYVFFDADGTVLEGERRVVEIQHCVVPMDPFTFKMLAKKHGPFLS